MIGSDVKPIKMQETTEKDSSRPLSSLYVDDADEEDEEDGDNYEEEFFNEDNDEEINPIRQSERETAKYEIMRVKRNGLNKIRTVVNSSTYSVLRKMKIKDISSSVRTEVLLEAISHKSKVVL